MRAQKNWSETRLLGKAKYVFRNGILAWGIPSVLAFIILIGFTNGGTFFESSTYLTNSFLFKLFTVITTFSFVGYFLGMWTWIMNEKSFSDNSTIA
ncbi:MAG: hypothetical protein HRT72_04680 [Flavobacteriales bacterium]|nr:hypothetical protein [Flavobacteriales bacterium]